MKAIEISSPNAEFDLALAQLFQRRVCAITRNTGDMFDVLVTAVEGAGLIRIHGFRVTFPPDAMADTYTVTNRTFDCPMVDIDRIEVLT